MGSVGKPIGRGRGRQLYTTPVRRPGNPQQNDPEYFQCMVVLAPTLKNQPDNILRALGKQIKSVCSETSGMREFFDKVYERSLQDKQFGKIAAFYVTKLIMAEVEGFRRLVLDKLQSNYEEREKLYTSQPAEFINFVSFMGQLYSRVVLRNGLPLKVLSKPIIDCLDLLLSPTTSEIITEQVLLNGEKLSKFVPEELLDLIVRVRALLVGPACDPTSRLLLLLLVEVEARSFAALPATVADFYESRILSDDVKDLVKRATDEVIELTTSTDTETNSDLTA